jgi:hypothetical protein
MKLALTHQSQEKFRTNAQWNMSLMSAQPQNQHNLFHHRIASHLQHCIARTLSSPFYTCTATWLLSHLRPALHHNIDLDLDLDLERWIEREKQREKGKGREGKE